MEKPQAANAATNGMQPLAGSLPQNPSVTAEAASNGAKPLSRPEPPKAAAASAPASETEPSSAAAATTGASSIPAEHGGPSGSAPKAPSASTANNPAPAKPGAFLTLWMFCYFLQVYRAAVR